MYTCLCAYKCVIVVFFAMICIWGLYCETCIWIVVNIETWCIHMEFHDHTWYVLEYVLCIIYYVLIYCMHFDYVYLCVHCCMCMFICTLSGVYCYFCTRQLHFEMCILWRSEREDVYGSHSFFNSKGGDVRFRCCLESWRTCLASYRPCAWHLFLACSVPRMFVCRKRVPITCIVCEWPLAHA